MRYGQGVFQNDFDDLAWGVNAAIADRFIRGVGVTRDTAGAAMAVIVTSGIVAASGTLGVGLAGANVTGRDARTCRPLGSWAKAVATLKYVTATDSATTRFIGPS
jgi:small ligand-binding sensory domain FIST